MDSETRQRIEWALLNWNDPELDDWKRFQAAKAKWDHVFQPLEDAIADSERITERDLSIRMTI